MKEDIYGTVNLSCRQDLSDQIHFYVFLTDKLRAFTITALLTP